MASGAASVPVGGGEPCRYLVAHGPFKMLERPRPCKRLATRGTPYCGLHQLVAARVAPIEVRDAGFCSYCAQPARSYVADGVSVALCARHGKALARALREGR